MTTTLKFAAAAGLVLGSLVHPSEASACGGFFCSASQPVNQAAERIIFSQNGDGTVTAVIQIMYQGPSENFSWLLPISTVLQEGDIGIASNLAFQRLQSFTNPQYNLTTRVEGNCGQVPGGSAGSASSTGGTSASGPIAPPDSGGVVVESSGVIGQFEWTVISLDQSLDDPAAAAVTWLEKEGYDVSPGSPELLGPYLADGMYLLALKLTKGSDSGSIRPISITYDAELPMIPIKLTAVAANDDMGVMTWVLGEERAIPYNYFSLELNEARINWFNAASNYDDVVTAAADEAGGQGFVTEFAGETDTLSQIVWSDNDDANFTRLTTGTTYSSFSQLFQTMNGSYGGFDGFWDAVRATVVLPAGVPFEDFRSCPNCYEADIEFSPSQFFAELEKSVIAPMRDVQELIDAHPYVTRLYSTLSAAEMTVDPLFSFNPELDDVANLHSAVRVVECGAGLSLFSAPWRVELPQGGVVRGTGQDAQSRTWPVTDEQPFNRRVLQLGESGQGKVAEDNSALIDGMNAPVAGGAPGTGGSPPVTAGAGGAPTTGGLTAVTGGVPARPTGGRAATEGSDAGETSTTASPESDDSGCSVRRVSGGDRGGFAALLGLFGIAQLVRRRVTRSRR